MLLELSRTAFSRFHPAFNAKHGAPMEPSFRERNNFGLVGTIPSVLARSYFPRFATVNCMLESTPS